MKRIDFATDQRVRSLGERLPYTLYKYMRVDDEQRLEWLRRLLVDGELYFASSAELNDPFECAIAPSFAASEDQILEYARDWVERQGQDPAGREAEVRQLVARASTEDFQKETERRYLDVTQSYGIASVTTTATNPLMWSYRSGPRNLDSGLSEISIVFQAAVPKPVAPKYTTSGVCRPSEL